MFVLSDQRHRRLLLLHDLDAAAGALPLVPLAPIVTFRSPMSPVVHGDRILAADHHGDRLVVHTPADGTWTQFGTESRPRSVSVDAYGRPYVVGRRLVRYDDLTGANPTVLIDADATAPVAVTTTAPDRIDVAMTNGTLRRSANGGQTWTDLDLGGDRTTAPSDISRSSHDIVYIGDLANARVVAVTADDTVETVIDRRHGLGLPGALTTVGSDLYVADIGWNRVRRHVMHLADVVAAEYVDGRRHDGSFLFDRITGIAEGNPA